MPSRFQEPWRYNDQEAAMMAQATADSGEEQSHTPPPSPTKNSVDDPMTQITAHADKLRARACATVDFPV